VSAVDREKLYEQVWTIPGSRLAPLYGISDVALAKACKRHKIPRPPRGYWAKLAAGQKPPRKPLPKLRGDRDSVVLMQGWQLPEAAFEQNVQGPNPDTPSTQAVAAAEAIPHELVVAAQSQLAAAKPDQNGLVRTDSKTAVDVRVSSDSVQRCLALCGTLIRKWEEQGGTVRAVASGGGQTALAIGEDEIYVRIVEEIDEKRPVSDPARLTGRLCAQLYGGDVRRQWADRKTQRLEKVMSTLVTTAAAAVAGIRVERLDAECVERQRRRVQDRRQAVANKKNREFGRRQKLMEYANRWHDAQRIREYLSALQAAIDAERVQPLDEAGFREWFEWATWFSDSIDPILQAPHPDEEQERPVNTPITELDLTARGRAVMAELEVGDSDELARLAVDRIREACGYYDAATRQEIHRVLEGLGYPTAKFENHYGW